jgi:hypothetical protein
MPQLMTRPSPAAFTSLIYITVGALMGVWSGIWYWYLTRHAEEVREFTWYWCYGFLLTGLVLFVIGLAVGQIGRSARHAELPPPEGIQAAAKNPELVAPPSTSPLAPPGTVVAMAPPLTPAAPDNRQPVAAPPAGRS